MFSVALWFFMTLCYTILKSNITLLNTPLNQPQPLLFGPLRPPSSPLKLRLALWSLKLALHPQTDLKRPKTDPLTLHTNPWHLSLAFRALSQWVCLILRNLCFSGSSWSLWRSEIASQTSWTALKSFKQTQKNIRQTQGLKQDLKCYRKSLWVPK